MYEFYSVFGQPLIIGIAVVYTVSCIIYSKSIPCSAPQKIIADQHAMVGGTSGSNMDWSCIHGWRKIYKDTNNNPWLERFLMISCNTAEPYHKLAEYDNIRNSITVT